MGGRWDGGGGGCSGNEVSLVEYTKRNLIKERKRERERPDSRSGSQSVLLTYYI